ncbi:hypothetical protein KZ813_16150 [Sphingomonas sp. RHCKR7]|uniref:hypothetical protein n=1 Tax=Sphingomonas folli TaxID=2862497 RepID=UPI001CA52D91|nr:hypothetical protein [Sphingomonas folli]MBW6528375.1 hypothetical protein [Sphingomonas folli]
MTEQRQHQLDESGSARVTRLSDEIKERLDELAAIFRGAVGLGDLPDGALKFEARTVQHGERRLQTVELICDGDQCGCITTFPNGRVLVEWPCGTAG